MYAHCVRVTVGFFAHVCSVLTDIVVDNCAICRNHIMDHCKIFFCIAFSMYGMSTDFTFYLTQNSQQIVFGYHKNKHIN